MARNFSTTATDKISRANYAMPTSAGAIAMWVKPHFAYTDNAYHFACTQFDGAVSNGFQIAKRDNNHWWVGWVIGGAAVGMCDYLFDDGNAWCLFFYTWDSTEVMSWWYRSDTGELGEGYISAGVPAPDLSSYPLVFGNWADTYAFDGDIGPIAIWNAKMGTVTLGGSRLALIQRVPFWRVMPENLIDYWPMTGYLSPEPNWSSNPSRTLTINSGTSLATSDPPILRHRNIGYESCEPGVIGSFWPVILRMLDQQRRRA